MRPFATLLTHCVTELFAFRCVNQPARTTKHNVTVIAPGASGLSCIAEQWHTHKIGSNATEELNTEADWIKGGGARRTIGEFWHQPLGGA